MENLRNIGVVAHIDAGKTTVSERMLFFAGVEHRIGHVDEGTAVMDWMAEERERGITITAAATTFPWAGCTINLVDTPGHVDFTVEVERCMRVLDGAVLVLDAVAGVQAQSETVWRQMRKNRVAALAFVNKCDRPGADFLVATESMRERLGAPVVPIQYPLLEGTGIDVTLQGVIDLVGLRAIRFDGEGEPREVDPPAESADEVVLLRSELIETLAGEDEELFQIVSQDREPDEDALKAAICRCTVRGVFVPVLCGSALRSIGVQPLLDAVAAYLPSPADLPAVVGTDPESGGEVRRSLGDDALCAFAFKIQADVHGDLTYVRVYSGQLSPGLQVYNPRIRRAERIARVLRMHADSRNALEEAGPGEIVALTGLKQTSTGDTLCDRDARILLEPVAFPEPVITMVVEPHSTADRDKLEVALTRLGQEDPTLHVHEDEGTGQWLVAGMGELHLEVIQHRLLAEFRVEAAMGKPRVAYREAPRRVGRGSARVERVLGGKQVFGAVSVEIRPAEDSSMLQVLFDEGTLGKGPEAIPQALEALVEEALLDGAQVGPQFGYPLVGTTLQVVGGGSDPARNSEPAFAQAANQALREAMKGADVVLLEPVMTFEIETPADFSSGIIADLNSRAADLRELDARGDTRLLRGQVPLAQMFGYSTMVRSLSQGRASFSMEPSGFRPVSEEECRARGLVWS